MIVRFLPPNRLFFDDISLQFGDPRQTVRAKLGNVHKESDQIIPLGEGLEPISQRRDIYAMPTSAENFFFLHYDKDDLLSELEVHRCKEIHVFDFPFNIGDDLDAIAMGLSRYSSTYKKKEGEYFFPDLQISIIDEFRMGGEEKNILSYFYCASDVSHLEGK